MESKTAHLDHDPQFVARPNRPRRNHCLHRQRLLAFLQQFLVSDLQLSMLPLLPQPPPLRRPLLEPYPALALSLRDARVNVALVIEADLSIGNLLLEGSDHLLEERFLREAKVGEEMRGELLGSDSRLCEGDDTSEWDGRKSKGKRRGRTAEVPDERITKLVDFVLEIDSDGDEMLRSRSSSSKLLFRAGRG